MNIKEYIASGIIEQYVLGLCTPAEAKEFEELCIQYPELLQARSHFEEALENQLLLRAVPVPPHLKEKIFSSLDLSNADNRVQKKESQGHVVSIQFWKLVAAASILLLLGSLYFSYSLYNKNEKLKLANADLLKLPPGHGDPFIALKPIAQKSSVKWAALLERTNSAHCMAHIYWDSVSKETFLLVGNIPADMHTNQFQLWGIKNNKPESLGSFDVKNEGQLIRMKNIDDVSSFVITRSENGENAMPAPQNTYAMGSL